MWTLYESVVVKRELNIKMEPLIYLSVYIPTFTYDHGNEVVDTCCGK